MTGPASATITASQRMFIDLQTS